MANAQLAKVFRSFVPSPHLREVGQQIDEFVNQLGKTPFQSVAARVARTDLSSSEPVNFPEIGKKFRPNKPLSVLQDLETTPAMLPSARSKQPIINLISTFKSLLEAETPKSLLKGLEVKIDNVPSEDEFFDLSKLSKKGINWDWFKQKGVKPEDITKLQAVLDEYQSDKHINDELARADQEAQAVAQKLDAAVNELLQGWLFQPGNVNKLLDGRKKRQEKMMFYLTASAEQILKEHPEWNEQINQDILNNNWAAFENPTDPQWDAKRAFVPKYPKDIHREHQEHAKHGHAKH
eukprot:TRINITY_DN1906_c0_g1_i1.p1 TRINITY_DN1906_c0_g1~~TRINITY_DN1906_c0_g1_i1.p1  ORF type:complete len:293 (-),score=87.71 TRINITY_DN1906_c0_g1_i1:128-1006(-)